MEGTGGGEAVVEVIVRNDIGVMETVPKVVPMEAVAMVVEENREMMIEISATMTRVEGLGAVALGIEDEALLAGGIGVQ